VQRRHWTFLSPSIPFLKLRRVFIVSSRTAAGDR